MVLGEGGLVGRKLTKTTAQETFPTSSILMVKGEAMMIHPQKMNVKMNLMIMMKAWKLKS